MPEQWASYGSHYNCDCAASRFISHIGNSIVPSLPDLLFSAHRLATRSATNNFPRISLKAISSRWRSVGGGEIAGDGHACLIAADVRAYQLDVARIGHLNQSIEPLMARPNKAGFARKHCK